MKYYDLSLAKGGKWYGLHYLKPVMIKAKKVNELRNLKGFTVLKNPSRELFRRAVEKSLVDAVLPDRSKGRDSLHYRKTLLNNVNAKLMNKNKVSLLFTFREILKSKGEERALIWGRMQQEIMICTKKKVPIMTASGAEKSRELVSASTLLGFGELLGLSPKDAKKALNYVQEKIIEREGLIK